MLQTGVDSKGFTLLELLISLAIVSFGMVMVYESLFISLDTLSLASERLRAVEWSDRIVWDTQDRLNRNGLLGLEEAQGQLKLNRKPSQWNSTIKRVGTADENLYEMELKLIWKTGSRSAAFASSAYLIGRTDL